MNAFRLLFVVALISVLISLQVVAGQNGQPHLGQHATFAWATPEVPAVVTFPLPGDLPIEEIAAVTIPAGPHVLSVTIAADPRTVQLTLQPEGDEGASFEAIEFHLESGSDFPYRVGPVRVVRLSSRPGPLDFEQAVTAPAGGLLLAAVLRNAGERDVSLTGVEYLPQPYQPGELLIAVEQDPNEALARLDQALTPANLWERTRAQSHEQPSEPQVPGFRRMLPNFPDTTVPPGQTAVLVWTPDAFARDRAPASYSLHPVVTYRVVGEAEKRAVGLPVGARSAP